MPGGKHAIGQCWDRTNSNDGTYEIFISPELDQPFEILHTLAHEMIHAIVGCEAGHKGEFVTWCKRIGLVKPWTATTPGPELAATLAIYALQLGPYLHARLNDVRKRQSTRMLKATCPNPDCEIRVSTDSDKPYTIRITQQWAGAGFRSLGENLDTTSSAGRAMMQMVGVFAEFERSIIRERTKAGLAEARKAGRKLGRRFKLTEADRQQIIYLVREGKMTAADCARTYHIHESNVSRLLAGAKAKD